MKKLGYPDSLSQWIRLYHFTISEYDKNLFARTFCILGKPNTKCTILIAIDIYSMDINNPDVKLVL